MKSIPEILRIVARTAATLVVTTWSVLAGQPPAATTSQVTNLTPINATLRGLVWPYGAETVAWFEWGSSTNYGNRIGMTNAGSAAWDGILIEATLSNLVASTKYHYRVAASNVWGKTYGANLVFTAPFFAEVGADLRVDQGSGGRRDVAGGTAAWGDYNLDGTLDVLLTGNYTSDGGYYGTIFRNEGNGTFASVLARSLLSGVSSAAWGDWNNDGNLDILAPALRGICINNGLGAMPFRNWQEKENRNNV